MRSCKTNTYGRGNDYGRILLFVVVASSLGETEEADATCVITFNTCHQNPVLTGIVDESQEAYELLNIRASEVACLSRASFHWLSCKNNITAPVFMTFLPTGASSSYPPKDVVEEESIVGEATAFSLEHHDFLDPLKIMGLPNGTTRPFLATGYFSFDFVPELQQLRPSHLGFCWIYNRVCSLVPQFAGIGDDFEYAYNILGVGSDENACMARARFHWELCGANPLFATAAFFAPSGASSSFPDSYRVENARTKYRHGLALDSDQSGWKVIHVHVGTSRYGGNQRAAAAELHSLASGLTSAEIETSSVQNIWKPGVGIKGWMGQCQQDFWVMKILNFKTGGFFLDLSAFDAIYTSNTVALELFHGWDGVCIEPMEVHQWGLR